MTDDEKLAALTAKYHALAHAVQSGVAMEMNFRPEPTEPKHLRTGLDCRAADHQGLVKLLIEKGVFTVLEYTQALVDSMAEEKARYEQRLNDRLGGGATRITLG